MRILIVEDADAICGMIEALLTGRSYEVKTSRSGAKGLEEAHAWHPDVVLVDVDLPGAYDGIAVCQKLREDDATRDTPVVIISAASDDEMKRRADEAGASAFYAKPFSPSSLLKEIETLARRSGRFAVP